MMISDPGAGIDVSSGEAPSRWKRVRWAISSATLTFPQAAALVAFALLAIALIGAADILKSASPSLN